MAENIKEESIFEEIEIKKEEVFIREERGGATKRITLRKI